MSLSEALNDVKAFHRVFGAPIRTTPAIPSDEERQLRWGLIVEEMSELGEAFANDDMVEISDALADLIYVAIGMALVYGIPLDEVWDEVQNSNMQKLGGGVREDGKILKPDDWEPPRIAEVLAKHA